MKLKFIITNEKNKDFIKLTNLLDDYYIDLFGDIALNYQKYNKINSNHDVCLVYLNNNPIACGSFKFYDEETVEMKRLFVLKEYQNQGIGQKILQKLEKLAKDKGYSFSILQTGVDMPAACNFYKNNNYEIIDNYDQFKGDSLVVCMKKEL
jgi:putative acetyltransferase